jgi:ATP-dependent Clp protease adaptor protein ClpS
MALEQLEEKKIAKKQKDRFHIVLHNDEVHTFDDVIDALIKYCNHTIEQATQCTYLVHYKGKCEVKTGGINELSGPCKGLQTVGLSAEISIG